MRNIRWGVLGVAAFARNTAIPAMQRAEGVELAGIASRDLARAEAAAKEFGFERAYGSYDELLADSTIEAIYNPLPNGLHGEWTRRAAEAGKHCIVEKPFASNSAEARTVTDAAGKHNVKVMEAFMWRFHPMHRRARDLIREGAIGKLELVNTSFTFTLPRAKNVRLDPSLAGGGIMDVGCYCVSAARFLFDQEPTRVFARTDVDAEFGVDVSAAGILEFPSGRALFDCGFTLPFRCSYEAVGTLGRVVSGKAFLPGADAVLEIERGEKRERETFSGVNQWQLEFEHFSKALVEGRDLDYGTEDALRQQSVIDAVYRSADSGQFETV